MRYGFLRCSGGGVLLKLLITVKLPRLGPVPSLKNAATCFNIPKLFPTGQALVGSLAKRPAFPPQNPPARQQIVGARHNPVQKARRWPVKSLGLPTAEKKSVILQFKALYLKKTWHASWQ